MDSSIMTKRQKKHLNRVIIKASLDAMKDVDNEMSGGNRNNLFLDPVTDDIAPEYSTFIQEPMSITTMEEKAVTNTDYGSLSDWEDDVELMFKNCINYNHGKAGKWYRGEAKRQRKIFRDEIYPSACRKMTDYDNKMKADPSFTGRGGIKRSNEAVSATAGHHHPEIAPNKTEGKPAFYFWFSRFQFVFSKREGQYSLLLHFLFYQMVEERLLLGNARR